MIDILMFDLGGVLTHFAGFEELKGLLSGTADTSSIRHRWIRSESVHLFERGDIGPEEFARRFITEWKLELQPEFFLREFAAWARGPYEGAINLLADLQGDFRIACLSNSNELHTPRHRDSLGQHVDYHFFSNEIGLAKPDREIFDFAIRCLGVPPDRILFFDDTAINVEVAAKTGMNAHLVDGMTDLRRCLNRLGLLSA